MPDYLLATISGEKLNEIVREAKRNAVERQEAYNNQPEVIQARGIIERHRDRTLDKLVISPPNYLFVHKQFN